MDRLGCFSVCKLVCPSICLPAHLFVYLSVRRSVSRSPCPQAGCLAGWQSVQWKLYLHSDFTTRGHFYHQYKSCKHGRGETRDWRIQYNNRKQGERVSPPITAVITTHGMMEGEIGTEGGWLGWGAGQIFKRPSFQTGFLGCGQTEMTRLIKRFRRRTKQPIAGNGQLPLETEELREEQRWGGITKWTALVTKMADPILRCSSYSLIYHTGEVHL